MENVTNHFKNRRNLGRNLLHWEHLPLLIIVIFTLALHVSFIMRPINVVGDEFFYVGTARSIINGEGDLILEHPPLAKLFIIAGIHIFGDNPFGWRFFSVLFGTISIILLYLICRKLRMSQMATNIAIFLFALDNMFFVHASLAWLDVYMVAFMLLGFLLYLYEAYPAMGVAFVLSALCKISGGLGILVVYAHWLLARRTNPKQIITSLITVVLSFWLLMTFFEYFINGFIIDAVQRTLDMLKLNATLTFTSTSWYSAVPPWGWLVPHEIFGYSSISIQYLSLMSWTIQILVIPAFVYMIYKAMRGNNAALFGVSWFTFTYLIWIPIVLVTDRLTFDFYILPATGVVCVGIGMALSDLVNLLKSRVIRLGTKTNGVKAAYGGIALYLFLHLAIFIIMNPALPDQLKKWLEPIIW
jgi:dolichyl-phosphate-mannose-protein mannosyltransferase